MAGAHGALNPAQPLFGQLQGFGLGAGLLLAQFARQTRAVDVLRQLLAAGVQLGQRFAQFNIGLRQARAIARLAGKWDFQREFGQVLVGFAARAALAGEGERVGKFWDYLVESLKNVPLKQ